MNDESTPSVAQKLALWANILRDCSARGLRFAANIYDRDNYQKIQDIALELHALASDQTLTEIEPLRSTIFAYPGALPCADGAVIDEEGKILLIQRADNALWAMPGGGLEAGETPAQGVVREIWEETGITCEPVSLVGIYDSRFCGTLSAFQLYQFSFLCRPLSTVQQVEPAYHAHESIGMGWFPEDALPENLDPGHSSRIPEAFRVWHGDQRAFFDRVETAEQS